MRLPGWLHSSPGEIHDGQTFYTFTVRRWHPGWWLACLRGRRAARRRLRALRKGGVSVGSVVRGLDLAWLLLVPAGVCVLAGLALGWLLWA